jgi:4-diphosphocytidyl-2C-methyl-D-erythritol kinase
VLPHHPEIRALRELLGSAGGTPVLMSGSGATVFAAVADEATARELVERARGVGAFATAVRTLTANPILTTE